MNVDLKYVCMKPKIELATGAGAISGRAKIIPIIVGAGTAYRF